MFVKALEPKWKKNSIKLNIQHVHAKPAHVLKTCIMGAMYTYHVLIFNVVSQ